jgi:hypothetical protein
MRVSLTTPPAYGSEDPGSLSGKRFLLAIDRICVGWVLITQRVIDVFSAN